jgi:hypothetical protein
VTCVYSKVCVCFLTRSITAMICNLTPPMLIAVEPSMPKLPRFQCSNKARTPSWRDRRGTISRYSRGGDDNCLLRHALVPLTLGSEASKAGGPCAGVLHDGQVISPVPLHPACGVALHRCGGGGGGGGEGFFVRTSIARIHVVRDLQRVA